MCSTRPSPGAIATRGHRHPPEARSGGFHGAREAALRRDTACSHIHQGCTEVLDQVLVSEASVSSSRVAIGDVRRVGAFNDHLSEGRDRSRSDHGFVRALLRLRMPDPA